ncbi:hypothetical protein [Paraburkholderia bannensis]|uniref:hypothetical protein n=1 Tax=Paraburkholderia bannensis TaxID=765414 RepID=UPI00048257B0|nr:hypothetical protein [Paraburkholderia bannensis]
MCSEIDPRTRENPEAAMLHNGYSQRCSDSAVGTPVGGEQPWPWPTCDDINNVRPVSTVVTEAIANDQFEKGRQAWDRLQSKWDAERARASGEVLGFDSEAHRRFMRSLG